MTFTYYHPTHYKKLKQNSRRFADGPSKNDVSEVNRPSNYGDDKVGKVSRFGLNFSSPTCTQPKEKT